MIFCHLAAPLDLREAIDDGALQGQVALPQTEYDRKARQASSGAPFSAESPSRRCDLVGGSISVTPKIGAAPITQRTDKLTRYSAAMVNSMLLAAQKARQREAGRGRRCR
jgi:hypothetical protein